ncbi:alpha/beta hydrolase family protein [Bacillus benzoevorans]|uniref:AB hydrolase-1 domain-containing protein n=1 Tax=Bacillus benzoevorans TaxID=1456 RepID=A0A7X0HT31_9BACI|nr:alpha/beta fold hydrolase [Bacillus benzoevorans]MBB6446347.1 hypothetical protein [Bacillus benzoevorans]
MKKQIWINWKQQKLAAVLEYPENLLTDRNYPLLIICHGFVGSKVGVDRLFVKTADALTKDGMIVLRFDYSGCGESSGDYGKTGLHDLIEQTRTVIEYGFNLKQVDRNNITLLGHSLGGAAAALTAANEKQIKRLILWSAVAHPFKDISRIVGSEKVRLLKPDSSIDYLGYELTKPFFDSLSGYEPLKAARGFSGAVLLIHGTGDEDIPVNYVSEYEKVFTDRNSGECTAYEIQKANHTYSNSEHFTQLIGYTRSWLRKQQALQEYSLHDHAFIV